MIARILQSDNVVGPKDLAMLQEVFEALCHREKISRHSAAGDELAKRVIQLYQAGAREPNKFMTSLQFQPSRIRNAGSAEAEE